MNTQQDLDKLGEEYLNKIWQYAEKVFYSKVKPYFDKHHLEFFAGNGSFTVQYTDKTPQNYINSHAGYYRGQIDHDKLPQWLQNILNAEVEGINGFLGEFMPNCKQDD